MRLHKTSFALIFILLLSFLIGSVSFAATVDEIFADARASVKAAEKASRTAVKNEKYQEAIDLYNKVANNKKYTGTPEAVKASYEIALIYGTAEGKIRNLNTSGENFKKLIAHYDQPAEKLADQNDLSMTDAREIVKTIDLAKKTRIKVATELDAENSKGILYKIIDFLVKLTHSIPSFSYWFAIVLITVIIKILITPLTKAQFKSMKEMQKIAPLVKEIQEKYKGDQATIGQKTMDMYKEHGVSPFASCLPILVQMPILMLLFYMINAYKFQFEKASFLWIGSSLSHSLGWPIPFGIGGKIWLTAGNLAEADLILLVLYVISMFISTKMSAVDPAQAEQQKMMSIMMPLMFAFIFAGYPSAFLLYWLVLNILQTAQQYLILKAPDTGGSAGAATEPSAPSSPGSDSGGGTPRARRRRR